MRPPMSVLPVFSKTMTTRRCFARWHPAARGRRWAGRERGGAREGRREDGRGDPLVLHFRFG